MTFDFIYIDKLKTMWKEKNLVWFAQGNNTLNQLRGLSISALNEIYINLSAGQYKNLDENLLIDCLTETIIHEYSHNEIYKVTNSNSLGDERIAKLLANQAQLRLKNEKFIN